MMKKNLLNKMKLGLAGLSLIGFSYFNANAQENYQPKYNTIAHKMLMIEDSVDDIPNNTYPTLKTLDNLIKNAENYLPKKTYSPFTNYTKEEIKEISKQIYYQIVYGNMPDINQRNDFCSKSSLVYLAIGQVYNLHFYASMLPSDIERRGHIFVRYDRDGKHDPLNPNNPFNKGDINIETTEGEIEDEKKFSDEFYMKNYYLKKESLEKNNYLRNLNEKELLSKAYSERMTFFFLEKDKKRKLTIQDFDAAIKDYNLAIKLDSNNFGAFLRRGLILNLKGEYKKAIENFEQALEICKDPRTYGLIAEDYTVLKEDKKAIQEYTNAINLIEDWGKISLHQEKSLDIYKSIWLIERYHCYKKLGNNEKANQDYKNFKDIFLKYAPHDQEKFPINKIDSVITSIFKIEE